MKKTIKKTGTKIQKTDELRRRAEEKAGAFDQKETAALSPEEIRQTLHELRVHQIELQMQNDELRRAQDELDASHARYFDLYDLAPVGYLTINEKGMILEVNLTAALLLGIARGKLIKQPLTRFILKEDQDIYYTFIRLLIETGKPKSCELRLIKNDGTQFWSLLEALFTHSESGEPEYRVVLSDITERKISERELLRMAERLSLAQISAGAGMWDWDMGTGKLAWSPEFFHLFGLEPAQADASFDTWRSVLHPQDIQTAEAQINDSIRDKKPLYNEYRIILPKGSVRWISAYGNTVYDKEAKPLRMTGICIDITERKEVETQLQIKNKMLASINEYTQAIVFTDPGQLYKTIVTKLKEVTGAAEIFFNDYDEEHSDLVFRQSTLSEESNTWLRKKLGSKFTNLRSPVSKEQYKIIMDSPIGRVGSLHDISFGAIPATIGRIIEKTFNFSWFVALALKHNEQLVGTIMIAGKIGQAELGNEELLAYASTTANVLARRKAEFALAESEEKYRELVIHAPTGIYEVDYETNRFTSVNDVMCEYTGYTKNELLSMNFFTLLTEDSQKLLLTRIEKLKTGEKTGPTIEYCIRTKNGDYIWGLFTTRHFYDAGKLKSVTGIIHNITERKMAEERLHHANMLMDSIVENIPDMVFLKDAKDLRFVLFNRAGEDLLGYSRNDMIGKSDYDFFPKEQADHFTQKDRGVLSGKKLFDIPGENIQTLYRGERILHTKKVPLLDANGEPEYLLGVSEDITESRKAEESLKESEARYRLLSEHTTDTIWLMDMDLNMTYHSPSGEKLRGFTAKEIMEMPLESQFTPESFKSASELIFKEMPKIKADPGYNPVIMLDLEYSCKNGSTVWAESRFSIIRDGSGKPVSILGEGRNVTDRKLTEAALLESENRFRVIFERSTIGKSLTAPDGTLLRVNAALADMLGYSSVEMQNLNFAKVTHPDDMDKSMACVRDLLSGELQDCRFEKRYYHKNGNIIWTDISTTLIRDVDDHPLYFITSIMDITERKRSDEALKESENVKADLLDKLNEAQHMAMVGSWEWNLLTDHVWWSDETYLIFGVKPQDYIPSFEENGKLIHPDDIARYIKSFEHSLQTGDPLDEEFRLFARDGLLKHCQAKGKVIFDSSKRPVRFIGTIMDISELKRAEEEKKRMEAQLHQAQKMESVGRLAGGVAHDYNNMLAVILGHAELALMKIKPEHPHHGDLMEIRKAAERSADLTRQLLAFARKQTIAPKVLDLNETVESMLKMLRMLIGEDIDLAWLPGKSVWPVKVDPSQIDQILANLCVNARDAITGVGRITIETGSSAFDEEYYSSHPDIVPGEYVRLSVSDNGCGMSKETIVNVFEPFFTTKELGKGTGLGLATVYGIVKQNNGFINVYSEPGQGTTFTICLPRHEGTAQVQVEGAAEQAQGGHETILLVEDEESILNMTTMMLLNLGYTVLAASSPGDAVRLAEEYASTEIHLLITDVVMPEMNGPDLARKLLSVYPHLKRLFMSGYTADVIANHGVLDDGVQFIRKPFSIMELAEKVREALDSK